RPWVESCPAQPDRTTARRMHMLDSSFVTSLAETFRGDLIGPSDPTYDEARSVYNAMIDKRPSLVARCADVADVIAVVNAGRHSHLPIAIRGGGHSGPG